MIDMWGHIWKSNKKVYDHLKEQGTPFKIVTTQYYVDEFGGYIGWNGKVTTFGECRDRNCPICNHAAEAFNKKRKENNN